MFTLTRLLSITLDVNTQIDIPANTQFNINHVSTTNYQYFHFQFQQQISVNLLLKNNLDPVFSQTLAQISNQDYIDVYVPSNPNFQLMFDKQISLTVNAIQQPQQLNFNYVQSAIPLLFKYPTSQHSRHFTSSQQFIICFSNVQFVFNNNNKQCETTNDTFAKSEYSTIITYNSQIQTYYLSYQDIEMINGQQNILLNSLTSSDVDQTFTLVFKLQSSKTNKQLAFSFDASVQNYKASSKYAASQQTFQNLAQDIQLNHNNNVFTHNYQNDNILLLTFKIKYTDQLVLNLNIFDIFSNSQNTSIQLIQQNYSFIIDNQNNTNQYNSVILNQQTDADFNSNLIHLSAKYPLLNQTSDNVNKFSNQSMQIYNVSVPNSHLYYFFVTSNNINNQIDIQLLFVTGQEIQLNQYNYVQNASTKLVYILNNNFQDKHFQNAINFTVENCQSHSFQLSVFDEFNKTYQTQTASKILNFLPNQQSFRQFYFLNFTLSNNKDASLKDQDQDYQIRVFPQNLQFDAAFENTVFGSVSRKTLMLMFGTSQIDFSSYKLYKADNDSYNSTCQVTRSGSVIAQFEKKDISLLNNRQNQIFLEINDEKIVYLVVQTHNGFEQTFQALRPTNADIELSTASISGGAIAIVLLIAGICVLAFFVNKYRPSKEFLKYKKQGLLKELNEKENSSNLNKSKLE